MENTENIIYEITKRKLIFNTANESKMSSIYLYQYSIILRTKQNGKS